MFLKLLKARADAVRAQLDRAIDSLPPEKVVEGMRHALSGGKGLRGFLVLESAAIHGVDQSVALGPAAAIEAMHSYSLVHDDLPAMDDDDIRRGQPTVHVKWDEATAILVGDALQSLAFQFIGESDLPAERSLRLLVTLSVAAGAAGMVRGQALDIAAESAGSSPLSVAEIEDLQAAKTGALIEWSAAAGPRMVGADPKPLIIYARALGLAFQIADDLLDVTGEERNTGKRLQKDAAVGKATMVDHLGVEGAQSRARELVMQAKDALSPYGTNADPLRLAADFVVDRDH